VGRKEDWRKDGATYARVDPGDKILFLLVRPLTVVLRVGGFPFLLTHTWLLGLFPL